MVKDSKKMQIVVMGIGMGSLCYH